MDRLILLVNDDGIDSAGLSAAWKYLRELGEVAVIAPEEHMSGAGKSISIAKELRVRQHVKGEMQAYSISGTPADCLLLGLFKIVGRKPDIVVSGINIGPNLGFDDFFSSGTIGVALEAAIQGINSICASYCTLSFEEDLNDLNRAGKVLGELVGILLRKGFPRNVDFMSLNFPVKFKGPVKLTRLARSPYPDVFEEISPGTYKWRSWEMDFYKPEKESDISAIAEGSISLTPISLEGLSNVSYDQKLEQIVGDLNVKLGF